MDLDLIYHRMLVSSRRLMAWRIRELHASAVTTDESLAAIREIIRARTAVETGDLEGQQALAAQFDREYHDLAGRA